MIPLPRRKPSRRPLGARRVVVLAGLATLLNLAEPARAVAGAWDDADIEPYPTAGFRPALNGGSGFDPWSELESGALYTTFLGPPIDAGLRSWGLSGTYAMGRGVLSPVAAAVWSLVAVHEVVNPTHHGFSGFNLKSSTQAGFDTDELLRFGILPSHLNYTDTGICVSTDRGLHYEFLDCGWTRTAGASIEYSVRWDGLGHYALTAKNLAEDKLASFVGAMPAGAVAMLGSAVYGASLDERLLFNHYTVIPEPPWGLLSLAAFAVALASWRFRRLPP
jgi:hypothetical protein